jgi:hypothetical protein
LIDDNGVGRVAKDRAIQSKPSLAIEFIRKRLELIDKVKSSGCGFTITDKSLERHGETGLLVEIKIPIMNI